MKQIALIATVLALSGCMTKQLMVPAEDHYVQTKVIAEKCRGDGYPDAPCSKELQEDLDAMVKGAEAIDAIAKGKAPKAED